MNNDLISRESLLKDIDEMTEEYSYERDGVVVMDVLTCVRDMVNDMLTAYDINRVVEQLESLDVGTMYCKQCKHSKECDSIAKDMLKKDELDARKDLCAMLMKSKAIEIVKGGGAE